MARVIVDVDGEEISVGGRAACMIVYLARNWGRVNIAQKGDVTFNFAFADITPKINAIDLPLEVGQAGGHHPGSRPDGL